MTKPGNLTPEHVGQLAQVFARAITSTSPVGGRETVAGITGHTKNHRTSVRLARFRTDYALVPVRPVRPSCGSTSAAAFASRTVFSHHDRRQPVRASRSS